MKKENSKKGFTIIEVVLVLAIAGLIFLMVFIALPAMQRGQRDTQRRDDMARFMSQLSQYQANNNGKIPTTQADYEKFVVNYLRVGGDTFQDPKSGNDYQVKVENCGEAGCDDKAAEGDDTIHVYYKGTCNGETPEYDGGQRKVAITYKLEGSGVYCSSN